MAKIIGFFDENSQRKVWVNLSYVVLLEAVENAPRMYRLQVACGPQVREFLINDEDRTALIVASDVPFPL